MTDVYLVKGNRYGFYANFPNRDAVARYLDFDFRGGPLPYAEKAEFEYYSGDETAAPMWSDFAGLAGSSLILRRSTTLLLAPLLERAGRVFPTNSWMGQELDLLLVTARHTCQEQLVNATEEDTLLSCPCRYSFEEDEVRDSTFFRPKHRPGTLFATNHVIDAVEAHHLTGLDYRLVWSSEREPFETPPQELVFTDPMKDGKSMATHAREAMQAILDRRTA